MKENLSLLSPLDFIPADIHCAADYESLAARFIPAPGLEYIAGGSGQDKTLVANRRAFDQWFICPRLLPDLGDAHTRLELLGREFAHPIFLAPVAYQKLAHSAGEIETARAASVMQSCMILSTLASQSLEEIAAIGTEEKWFQLYFQPNIEATLDLIRRAEAANYRALVVTLDATIRTPSLGALRSQFQMPADCVAVNLQDYEINSPRVLAAGESRIFKGIMQDAPTWADLQWLINQTHLPVIVKGVLHPDDALRIKKLGAAAVVVSNHGGRSFDGAMASLNCLAAIRAILGDEYPVLFDGGIRSGLDIFKAIALGADAVLIGRLQVYALSVAGALGVAHMLKLLREELELCMAQAGCANLQAIRNCRVEKVSI